MSKIASAKFGYIRGEREDKEGEFDAEGVEGAWVLLGTVDRG